MQMVVICENFGWTFEEYNNQPDYFIELIKQKMRIDAQRSENELKKNKK